MSQTTTFLLKAFDDNWSHRWESLHPILVDITDHEASWQHQAYTGEHDPMGLAEPGTIRWHVGHLEQNARRYVHILRSRPVAKNPEIPAPALINIRDMVDRFQHVRNELRAEIAQIHDADLDDPCRGEMTVAEFVRMVIRHETWHAGQIVVIRRLYRTSRANPALSHIR